MAEPYLPVSSYGFDGDPTWITAMLLYDRAEFNAWFLCSHVPIIKSAIHHLAISMSRTTPPTYLSGDKIQPGDHVLYHGERGRIEFVAIAEDPDAKWYFEEYAG